MYIKLLINFVNFTQGKPEPTKALQVRPKQRVAAWLMARAAQAAVRGVQHDSEPGQAHHVAQHNIHLARVPRQGLPWCRSPRSSQAAADLPPNGLRLAGTQPAPGGPFGNCAYPQPQRVGPRLRSARLPRPRFESRAQLPRCCAAKLTTHFSTPTPSSQSSRCARSAAAFRCVASRPCPVAAPGPRNRRRWRPRLAQGERRVLRCLASERLGSCHVQHLNLRHCAAAARLGRPAHPGHRCQPKTRIRPRCLASALWNGQLTSRGS